MNDRDRVDERLAAADPARHAHLDRRFDTAVAELAAEITATSRLREARPGDRRAPGARPRRFRPAATTAFAAGLVAVGALGFVAGRAGDGQPAERAVGQNPVANQPLDTHLPTTTAPPTTAPPPASLAAAPTIDPSADLFAQFPFTILPSDTWVLTRVDQQLPWLPMELRFHRADVAAAGTTVTVRGTNPGGELVSAYTDDGASVEVTWYAEDRRESWSEHGAAEIPVTVLGHAGVLLASPGADPPPGAVGSDDVPALWIAIVSIDGGSVEFRIDARDQYEAEQILAGFETVDTETFDAALPATVVAPDRRSAVVTQMLAGVRVPPDLDLANVRTAATYSDWYQLGARVAATVSCAWFDRWFTATDAGDSEAASVAAEALAATRGWPLLQQMQRDGAYPEVLWQYAGAVTGGEHPGGVLTRAEVDAGLGCEWGLEQGGEGTIAVSATAAPG